MNYTNPELSAQQQREMLIEQMKGIRLEEKALDGRADAATMFEQSMVRLAGWMISTGDALRRRYEKSCLDCPQPAGANFIRGQL